MKAIIDVPDTKAKREMVSRPFPKILQNGSKKSLVLGEIKESVKEMNDILAGKKKPATQENF